MKMIEADHKMSTRNFRAVFSTKIFRQASMMGLQHRAGDIKIGMESCNIILLFNIKINGMNRLKS